MKKLLYLSLALMLAAALCACGESETAGNTTTGSPSGTTVDSTTGTTQQPTTGTAEHTHDYKETVVTAATCTEKGMMFLKCNTCGDSDYKEIPATGHTEVIDAAVAPTCTVHGLTEGKHCSACNKILVAQYSVNIIDHDYEQQICKACGKHEFLGFRLNEDDNSYYVYRITSKNFAGEIIIPEKYKGLPVTSIGDSTFSGCSSLTSITIPDSVISIGKSAFYDCTLLTSITIPDSVTSIGDYAFFKCSSLTSVEILGNTSIGGSAFEDCCNLARIKISDNVTGIGRYAFLNTEYYNNSNNWIDNVLCIGNHLIQAKISDEYTVKEGTKCIAGGAFYGCTGLTSITIPDSVTSIGDYAFYNCTGLTSITIPGSVTSISDCAFHSCTGLTSIEIAKGNTAYYSAGNCLIETATKTLIWGCQTSVIPTDGSVTNIGDYAFFKCTGLTSIEIPDSVTSIGVSAFAFCSNLENVTFGENSQLRYVGETLGGFSFYTWGTFAHCTKLESITMPGSVTLIGDSIFAGNRNLTRISFEGTMAQWKAISKSTFWDDSTGSYTIYCTDGTISK